MKKYMKMLSLLLCTVFLIAGCGNHKTDKKDAAGIKALNKANVGDVVRFGTYEQDNNTTNGKEAIEWIVLEKKDKKLLLISKHSLDATVYHNDTESITWPQSIICSWMNDTFSNNAFSREEVSKITTDTVADNIFLLDLSEAKSYYNIDGFKECKPTPYAIANGAGTTSQGYAWWWLRSVHDEGEADYLYFANGKLMEGYASMDTDKNSVRPSIWVTID